jgi:hypothetical protein
VALRALKRASTLTFRPRDFAPRHAAAAHSPPLLKEMHAETGQGHIDVMQGHLVLFSVPCQIAEFSSHPDHCTPRALIAAKPKDGCVTHQDEDYEEHEGKYVLALRGGCSFAAKGANAGKRGGGGGGGRGGGGGGGKEESWVCVVRVPPQVCAGGASVRHVCRRRVYVVVVVMCRLTVPVNGGPQQLVFIS